MDELPFEMLSEIMRWIPSRNLWCLSQTSRALRRYALTTITKPRDVNHYREVAFYHGNFLVLVIYRELFKPDQIIYAVRSGHVDIIRATFHHREHSPGFIERGVAISIKRDYLEIFQIFMKVNNFYYHCLRDAIWHGAKNIYQWLIASPDLVRLNGSANFDICFDTACKIGDITAIDLLFEKFPDMCDLRFGIQYADIGGHTDAVEHLLDLGIRDRNCIVDLIRF